MKGTDYARAVAGRYQNRISLKLTDDSGVRSQAGEFEVRAGAPLQQADARVHMLKRALSGRRYAAVHMHPLPEGELDRWEAEAEAESGDDRPNLNRWYYLYVDARSTVETRAILDQLNALDFVEIAYASLSGGDGSPPATAAGAGLVAPWPTNATILARDYGSSRSSSRWRAPSADVTGHPRPPSQVPPSRLRSIPYSFQADQEYVYSTYGVGRDYLQARYWNWTGYRTHYTDMEKAWNDNHLGLAATITGVGDAVLYPNGIPNPALISDWAGDRNHGTKVLGIISSGADDNNDGKPDDWGTVGLAFDAQVALSTDCSATWNIPNDKPGAITAALSAEGSAWGSVILLEEELTPGTDPANPGIPVCTTTTWESRVPVEWDAATHQAIEVATRDRKRVVVETASNGSCNLDSATFFGDMFTSSAHDSNAIFVGASNIRERTPAEYSAFGSRIDSYAGATWAATGSRRGVVTTGTGDLYSSQGENYWYTDDFNGTSAAGAIVTGAVVALSSVHLAYYGSFMGSREFRQVIRTFGNPQASGHAIGSQPNLRRMVNYVHNRHLSSGSSDIDGDGKADIIFWDRGYSLQGGTWTIKRSGSTAAPQTITGAGGSGDIPVVGRYLAGTSGADLVLFTCPTAPWNTDPCSWRIKNTLGDGYFYLADEVFNPRIWGYEALAHVGDVPIPLDSDGDGIVNMAVYRPRFNSETPDSDPNAGSWSIRVKSGSLWLRNRVYWGLDDATPLAADFNGDGKDDLAVVDTAGDWWILPAPYDLNQSMTIYAQSPDAPTSNLKQTWGDIPLVYHSGAKSNAGKRYAYPAYYRPVYDYVNNMGRFCWYDWRASSPAEHCVPAGEPGDIPRVADTNGDGADELLIYSPKNHTLRNVTLSNVVVTTIGTTDAFVSMR